MGTNLVRDIRVGAIEYFVGPVWIEAAVIDEEAQCRVYPLCRSDECLTKTHQLLDVLEGPSTPNERAHSLESFSTGWGRKLLPPYEAITGFDVLVLIPHHTLHALPLHAIWIEEEKTSLAICRGVTYCSSATLFVRCAQRNAARQIDGAEWRSGTAGTPPVSAPPPPRLCAGIGGDAWDGKDESYKKLGKLFGSYFEECNGPEVERFSIKRPYRVGSKERPSTYDAIYMVCHGYHDPVQSVNSGLLVGRRFPGTTERAIELPGSRFVYFRDLPFREIPREITPRPDANAEMMTIGELKVEGFTQAELVALLGCSTSAGHVLSGDLMQSIGHQWLQLGAASVLAGMWRLDIDFISKWTSAFLDNWLRLRQPKAIAWSESLRAMLSGPAPPPLYHWAAVQLMGDWL
jgi:hypothetical protein